MDKTQDTKELLEQYIYEGKTYLLWTEGTVKSVRSTCTHILKCEFLALISGFDEHGLNRFLFMLRERGLREKTVRKHYLNLKAFLTWTQRRMYSNETYIDSFTPRFKITKKPVIYLTREELMKLYRLHIPENGVEVRVADTDSSHHILRISNSGGLSRARDIFCFCAFTSLRYSDAARLKKSDIVGDRIYICTQKTNDSLIIDLNTYSKEIIRKYTSRGNPDDKLFPSISNQKLNIYIKTLGQLCGLIEPITEVYFKKGKKETHTLPKWKMLGTHAARRTFICCMLSAGIPPQTIMKWTGHNDYKAMKPYIDICSSDRTEAMCKFADTLSSVPHQG